MNAADYLGFNDWRLESAFNQDGTGPCSGFNCNSSEMGYMFYENFGGSAGSSVTTSTDPNFSLFDNFQSAPYWSGVEFDSESAWTFDLSNGFQPVAPKISPKCTAPVRSGDVGAAATVPEPATAALLGASLIGFAAARRRVQQLGASVL